MQSLLPAVSTCLELICNKKHFPEVNFIILIYVDIENGSSWCFPQPPTASVSIGPGGAGGHTTGNLNDCVPPTSMMQSQMSNGEIETRRLIRRWSFALSSRLLLLPACVWAALLLVSLLDSLVMVVKTKMNWMWFRDWYTVAPPDMVCWLRWLCVCVIRPHQCPHAAAAVQSGAAG